MKKSVALLFSVLAALLVGSPTTSAATYDVTTLPAVLSTAGLDCLADLVGKKLNDALAAYKFPELKGSVKAGLATVTYSVGDLYFDLEAGVEAEVKVKSTSSKNKIYAYVGAYAELHASGKFSYEVTTPLSTHKYETEVEITLIGVEIQIELLVKVDDNGLPIDVSLSVCAFTYNDIKIKISGTSTFLGNALGPAVEKSFEAVLENGVCLCVGIVVDSEGVKLIAELTILSSLTGVIPGADPLDMLVSAIQPQIDDILEKVTGAFNEYGTVLSEYIPSDIPLNLGDAPIEIVLKVESVDVATVDDKPLSVTAFLKVKVEIYTNIPGQERTLVFSAKLKVKAEVSVQLKADYLDVLVVCAEVDLEVVSSYLPGEAAEYLDKLKIFLGHLLCDDLNQLAHNYAVALGDYLHSLPYTNPVLEIVEGVVLLVLKLLCSVLLK
jgi:hypothetical protein